MIKYYVLGDMKTSYREACVFDTTEVEQAQRNYSGWYPIATFETEAEALEFCEKYNNYECEPDVELGCCENGCTMSAYEYEHWNGKCAYQQ